jgi:DNA-binding LacI/PurR family transcriptional regulator
VYKARGNPRSGGRPTRNDVAKHANISGATVSRVLSGRLDVQIAPETRARVLEAAAELGYHPNLAARALVTGRTGLIGFWMDLRYSRYRGRVLDEMRGLVEPTDLALAVMDVDNEYRVGHSFDRALGIPVDGIIAFDNSISVETFGREHDRLAPQKPFVSMGAYWSEAQSFVGINLKAGAELAMDHLLDSGRRKIAYMAPFNSGLHASGPRFEAFREKMETAGQEPISILVERVTFQSMKEALEALPEMPDAILCMNDDLAIVATYVLPALGRTVGTDVALVGFDGIEEGEHASTPITTVRQPIEEMCVTALEFLRVQIDDAAAPLRQRILTPELVIRESSRP